MKRRGFLKTLGIGLAAPVVAKAKVQDIPEPEPKPKTWIPGRYEKTFPIRTMDATYLTWVPGQYVDEMETEIFHDD